MPWLSYFALPLTEFMERLYPLKFAPILKDKIWGGSKLTTLLGKNAGDKCGESWEVSGVRGDESIVVNGSLKGRSLSDLLREYEGTLVGQNTFKRFGLEFPILVKFIDANADLSVQVHPNDAQSDGQGKTEMWYVVDADENATLLSGFNETYSKEELREAVNNGSFSDFMNKVPVHKGSTFFIEANQVHTIGQGNLILEIQQTSDITYRIYDFDRVDDKGNKRDLHLDEAFDVMKIDTGTGQMSYEDLEEVQLVSCPEFVTSRMKIASLKKLQRRDSFQIIICIEGEGKLVWGDEEISLNMGESILIPSEVEASVVPSKSMLCLITTVS